MRYLLVLIMCSVCFAKEAPSEETTLFMDFLYRILNFGVMLAILYVAIKRTNLKDFFAIRREEIRKKFEELQRQKSEFEKKVAELEKKLKEMEDKREEIIEQFREEGRREKERIIAQAKERAKQIMAQADEAIQREIQLAKDRLRDEIVELATEKAKQLIASSIKEDDQERLVEEFIEKVERIS